MRHFPRQTPGCYHSDRLTCCWLCWFRIARAEIAVAWRFRHWRPPGGDAVDKTRHDGLT